MMDVTVTSINFNYENGYNADYTGINLHFANSGQSFNLSGYITVTNAEYLSAAGDINELKSLIKQKVIDKLQEPKAE